LFGVSWRRTSRRRPAESERRGRGAAASRKNNARIARLASPVHASMAKRKWRGNRQLVDGIVASAKMVKK